jgi:hypothetical protein
MILTTSIEWNDRAFVELPSGSFDQKAGYGPPGRRRGGKGSAVLDPAF